MQNKRFKPELPLVHDYLEKWAKKTPEKEAIVEHNSGVSYSYKKFNDLADFYALSLLDMGMQKGDRVASMGLKTAGHIALQYACFKIGCISCPLDLKLKPHEAIKNLHKITPRLFFMHGTTPMRDFHDVGRAVLEECPYVKLVIQNNIIGNEPILEGAISSDRLFNKKARISMYNNEKLLKLKENVCSEVKPEDGALIIFTTGTTGEPKPALLQHSCIVSEMEIAERSAGIEGNSIRRLCILPDSHVGGTTISMYPSIYSGGTNILLPQFSPKEAMKAIGKWKASWIGGVPTMFRMMWALPDYETYDISSLECAYYAGSSVDRPFLEKLSTMAPKFGTSLGMTECGGIATYTPFPISIDELMGQVGKAAEDVGPITIRKPMKLDGTAGDELPDDEDGEVCYHPPIVFKEYLFNIEATECTLSREGILYSGDIGHFKNMGHYRGLFLKGRSKFMIKQKGYNVFPDEVAAHIAQIPGVAQCEIVGIKHKYFDEGIFAFVKPEPGKKVTAGEVMQFCKSIAAFKRPQHVEIVSENFVFPLVGTGKTDRIALEKEAGQIVDDLRKQNKWDMVCNF